MTMSDLIRREDVLAVLCFSQETGKMVCGDLRKLLEEIKAIPSAEPERKWIPVTEALPKEKEIVLITNKKGHVRCGQYQRTFDDKNYRWWWKHNTLEEVLAWMPLPEPWRGE